MVEEGISVFSVPLWFAFSFLGQSPSPEPAAFHHFHLNSPDPAGNMEYFAKNHGAIKVILQGFGVGVRIDKAYALFERVDDEIAPQTWKGVPQWFCRDAERCF